MNIDRKTKLEDLIPEIIDIRNEVQRNAEGIERIAVSVVEVRELGAMKDSIKELIEVTRFIVTFGKWVRATIIFVAPIVAFYYAIKSGGLNK